MTSPETDGPMHVNKNKNVAAGIKGKTIRRKKCTSLETYHVSCQYFTNVARRDPGYKNYLFRVLLTTVFVVKYRDLIVQNLVNEYTLLSVFQRLKMGFGKFRPYRSILI